MAEKELKAARAKAEHYKSDLQRTTAELKDRLTPAHLATEAWHTVRDKGMEYSGKGAKAATARPGAAGGAAAAVLLLLFRKPLAHFLSWTFGSNREPPGAVKADLLHASKDYDLTAPVVTETSSPTTQGV